MLEGLLDVQPDVFGWVGAALIFKEKKNKDVVKAFAPPALPCN